MFAEIAFRSSTKRCMLLYPAMPVCHACRSGWPHVGGRNMAHSRLATMEVIMPDPVQISLRIPGTAPIRDIAHLVQDVEAAGFAGAGSSTVNSCAGTSL